MNNTDSNLSWFSPEWFYPQTFYNISWEYPYVLYLLALVPAIFVLRWLFNFRFRQKLDIALPKNETKVNSTTFIRFIPDVFMTLVLSLIIVALARPQKTNEKVDQWTEGIDIVLALDISESMKIEDFKPNRLTAAKSVALDFVKGRFQDRIGLVIFAGDAYSLAPLTTDYELLYSYIDDISFDKIENRGTAIGSALAVSTNRLRESEAKSKVIILMSDGDNTAGNIDPITAAELAYAYDIKIYSVAIGKEGKVPMGKDFFGRTNYIDNTLDETTLRTIADIGKGRFFRASDNEALQEVFEAIDQYEKVEIKESTYKNTTDFYNVYLIWAILFFLIWLLLKSTFVSNALQD